MAKATPPTANKKSADDVYFQSRNRGNLIVRYPRAFAEKNRAALRADGFIEIPNPDKPIKEKSQQTEEQTKQAQPDPVPGPDKEPSAESN